MVTNEICNIDTRDNNRTMVYFFTAIYEHKKESNVTSGQLQMHNIADYFTLCICKFNYIFLFYKALS